MARSSTVSSKGDSAAISSLALKGFESIVDQQIELGQLNVLIGANGAGKTAVLEAIGVLGAAADVASTMESSCAAACDPACPSSTRVHSRT